MPESCVSHWHSESKVCDLKARALIALVPLFLVGCAPAYALKKAGTTAVARGAFIVQPSSSWNLVPKDPSSTKWEEVWTQNGPLLDTIEFIGGLPEGESIVVQKKEAERRVPLFRANMSPEDLVTMVEISYRTTGVTVFNVESVDPAEFLGGRGVRLRFNYVPGDGITKKGDCVMRVVGNKLYLMKLDGVASHYFYAAEGEFDLLVATAALPK
jgi:hypothetical protein